MINVWNMKKYINIAILAIISAALWSCVEESNVDFGLETGAIEMEADGGTVSIQVSSPGAWTASANVPWITVSPANGNGSHECRVKVDSALELSASGRATREGIVTISMNDGYESRNIDVTQKNYGYSITVDETDISIPDYEALTERNFEVTVKSNVLFNTYFKYADGEVSQWIEADESNPSLQLTKGSRPRNVTLKFNWDINNTPEERVATIEFRPAQKSGDDLVDIPDINESLITRIDVLNISQGSGEPKPTDLRAADSTALIAISRALNVWSGGWDTSTRMERWSGVTLWQENDEGYTEDKAGRVKYARFFMFNTDEGIPYQVEWLDKAEELIFYSNENNTLRKDIKLGEHLTTLHQLKRLSISAFGLDDNSLPESFFTKEGGSPAFPLLESLDLSSNNFTKVPDGLNETNFPALKTLRMSNNQRYYIYDMSTATVNNDEQFAERYAGLYAENFESEGNPGGGFPVEFLTWENLDTLHLTLNYLQGSLPSDAEVLALNGNLTWDPKEEALDTIVASDLTGTVFDKDLNPTGVPKILPNLRSFSINLNHFSGMLPNWVLFHPLYDWWDPYTLIFNQEGRDRDGNTCGFINEPPNMNDYYKVYPRKKLNGSGSSSTEE